MTDATHKAMTGFSSEVPVLRMKFDKSGGVFKTDRELDQDERNRIADVIKNAPQLYSADEERIIMEGKEFYTKCKDNDKGILVKMVSNDGDTIGTGIASAIVDASMEECAAREFYLDLRGSRKA